MTDYEPWAGANYYYALEAETMYRELHCLKYIVYKNKQPIAAFINQEDAKKFKGKRRLLIKEIPFHVPFPKDNYY